jgi:hypothetical protein
MTDKGKFERLDAKSEVRIILLRDVANTYGLHALPKAQKVLREMPVVTTSPDFSYETFYAKLEAELDKQ